MKVLFVAGAGARDGDTQAGSGGGAEEEGGPGETAPGGDEPEAEAGGEGGEAPREAEITGVHMTASASAVLLPSVSKVYKRHLISFPFFSHSPGC